MTNVFGGSKTDAFDAFQSVEYVIDSTRIDSYSCVPLRQTKQLLREGNRMKRMQQQVTKSQANAIEIVSALIQTFQPMLSTGFELIASNQQLTIPQARGGKSKVVDKSSVRMK